MRTIGAFLLMLGFLTSAGCSKGDAEPKIFPPRFNISKETTFVTEPVDKDGYIDYVTALNQRLSEGVTPENNANLLIWKVLGPQLGLSTVSSEFFHLMGVPAPPKRGEYFINLDKYGRDNLNPEDAAVLSNQLDIAIDRPWLPKEFPHIAAWLRINEKPLALLLQASKRSHYYWPRVPPAGKIRPSFLHFNTFSYFERVDELARALAARSLLRVNEGFPEEAWQDLLACHRLGRLIGQGGSVYEGFFGIRIDRIAWDADLAFLETVPWKAQRIKDARRDLQSLPARAGLANKIDLYERFFMLDTILLIDRHPLSCRIQLIENIDGCCTDLIKSISTLLVSDVDFDPAFRAANFWFQRAVATLQEKDRAARKKKLGEIKTDEEIMHRKLKAQGQWIQVLLFGDKAARGKAIGDLLIDWFAPNFDKCQDCYDAAEQWQANLSLAFALAAYHRDHAHYPDKLDALAPHYLARIPQDLFSGKPLIYRPSEKGYLLYSVGVNGKDEGGRGFDDEPPGDDLSVRMPRPRPQRE